MSNVESTSPSSGLSSRQIGLIVAGVLALIFIFQNTATGRIRFLFFSFDAPVWIFFFLLLLIGAAIGWFARIQFVKRKAGS